MGKGLAITYQDPTTMEQRTSCQGIGIIPLIIMSLTFAGLLLACSEGPQETETVPTPTVDVNTISVDTGIGWVSAEGRLIPSQEATLSVPVSGRVAEIIVAEGDRVSKGDPLLRLESDRQESNLKRSQSNLSLAEANLESAKAELAAAQSERALAELDIEGAENQLAYLEAGPTSEQIAISESAVNAAEAGVAAATGNQALVLEGPRQAQILAAESQLRLAQAAEKQARDALNAASGDEQTFLEDQLIAAVANVNAAQAALAALQRGASQSERLAAGSAVAAADARRDEAQAQLNLLLSGASEQEIEIARVGVQQAEARLARTEKAVVQAEMAVAQAEASIEQAKAAVATDQAMLNQLSLAAPFDGTISSIFYRPGEVASPGVVALEVVDLDSWLVETTNLNEQDVVALTVGLPAEIRLDALPGEILNGTITKIAPRATEESGETRFRVLVQVDDPANLPLRWGMTADVDIEVR